MKRIIIMLMAVVFSGLCLENAYAKKDKVKKLVPVAGPDGVDNRITLTPVLDDSCDWKYKSVLVNHDIAGPSEISCIVQIPDWVPLDKREDPSAKYYLYHSNHGGASIIMNWAKSMEDLIAGNLPKVKPITIESSTLVAPAGKKGVVGDWIRTPMTIDLEGALSFVPLHIDHISAPDIYIDHENKRFVMFYHGFDKGQFLDLPVAEIEAADGLNGIGRHMHFAATSPYARNFNPYMVDGIEGGGYEGYGPIMSVDGYHSDNRKRLVVMGYRYGKHFKQHGRFYTMGREGLLSRAPETNPFKPEANGHLGNENYWPREFDEGVTSYNRRSAVQDWMKAGKGVVMAEHLQFQNNPKNPTPGSRARTDINHVGFNRINDTHFEIFVITKANDYPDIYRLVLDATSEDWKDWHLEHDENGVIFDVVVNRETLIKQYNTTHGTNYAFNEERALANPSIFIDNKGTENEQRYLTFSGLIVGLGNIHGIIRLDKE